MSSPEQFDPTIDLLRRLPNPSPPAGATARVRRRCHAVLARRASRQARGARPDQLQWRLADAVWIVPLGLYLLASVVETVKVASSL